MTATKSPETAPSATEFSGTGTILNPATGAIAGLRVAQREWEQRGAKGRAKVLARFAVWLGEHRGVELPGRQRTDGWHRGADRRAAHQHVGTEETFGPTLPIMKVGSVDEAVRLANDSEYGLSASVFSRDVDRANEVALQLDCGAVNINDLISNLMCTTAPMGGWKTSGIGARFGGAEGLRKFCRAETVVEPRTNVGAGGSYYHNSLKALQRTNKLMTRLALARPRRAAKKRPHFQHFQSRGHGFAIHADGTAVAVHHRRAGGCRADGLDTDARHRCQRLYGDGPYSRG